MEIKELEHQYTNNIKNKRILIVGLYPPPIGGISIHVRRVELKLTEQKNIVNCLDVLMKLKTDGKIAYLFSLFANIFRSKYDLIYYHTLILWKFPIDLFLLVILRMFFNYKLIFVDHTPRFFYQKSKIYKKILSLYFRFVDQQILIGDSTYKSYLDNKIFLKNFNIESPFLPPNLKNENEIILAYPKELIHFLEVYKYIILFNASGFKLHNNIDLYGFDFAIRLIKDLNNNKIGLILACGSIDDYNYYNEINSKIKSDKNIYLLLRCQQEIWPLIKRSTVFIRPTLSDAFGISVQEAIYFNVPCIASNVCLRPKGTILFNSRDYNDFLGKVKQVLHSF